MERRCAPRRTSIPAQYTAQFSNTYIYPGSASCPLPTRNRSRLSRNSPTAVRAARAGPNPYRIFALTLQPEPGCGKMAVAGKPGTITGQDVRTQAPDRPNMRNSIGMESLLATSRTSKPASFSRVCNSFVLFWNKGNNSRSASVEMASCDGCFGSPVARFSPSRVLVCATRNLPLHGFVLTTRGLHGLLWSAHRIILAGWVGDKRSAHALYSMLDKYGYAPAPLDV